MINLKNYKDFNEVFPNFQELKKDITDIFNTKNYEVFVDENWFFNLDSLYEIIYNSFSANYYNQIFKWEAPKELEYGIKGIFLPKLFSEILNFYKNQIPLTSNDIKELRDWEQRGIQFLRDNNSSASNASTPADDFKWVVEKDIPQSKIRNLNEMKQNNRVRELFNLLENNLRLYFDDITSSFQYIFLSKYILKGDC